MKKIKVCGLNEAQNILEVQRLNPDFMGFIFYSGSPRYIGKYRTDAFMKAIQQIPLFIKRCGVFVDAQLADILEAKKSFDLAYIQLHGAETPAFCQGLKTLSEVKLIKAFGIHPDFDFNEIKTYDAVVDYYLFDTQSVQKGGSGRRFDWKLIENYKGDKPYLLSGGIGLSELELLREFKDPRCLGIDVNSRVELSPGIKDIPVLKNVIKQFRELQ